MGICYIKVIIEIISRKRILVNGLQDSIFKNKLKFIASSYHTQEQEYYDILAQYRLGEVNTDIGDEDLGDVEFSEGIGGQLNHGRNDLDALITTIEHKGDYEINDHDIEWSVKYTNEDIRDRLVEWEVIDSAGFSINPPKFLPKNDQPYSSYIGPLVPYQNVRATNYVTINRFSGYAQWNRKGNIGTNEVWFNAGFRMHQWQVETYTTTGDSQITFSPRAQFTLKPNWKR